MATRGKGKVTLTWRELSEALSIAEVLTPKEDIDNLTLVKPRSLLILISLKERKSKTQLESEEI